MPGDALLRAVVQRERQAPALVLLDAQEAVGESPALALAQLGLDAQGLGEREQARVVRRAHRSRREHAQLGALDGAERPVERAQHGERAVLERRHRQRRDLDGAAVGCRELGCEIRDVARAQRGRAPGLADRRARDDAAAAADALEHEAAVGRDEIETLLGDALEQAALVELVGEPGRRGEQPVEGVGLRAQLLAQRALGLDVALGRSARAARAHDQCREHAEGDREQDSQHDLLDAHGPSIRRPAPIITR